MWIFYEEFYLMDAFF